MISINKILNPVIREGKDALSKAQGVRVIKTSKTEVTCEVRSGSYSFIFG